MFYRENGQFKTSYRADMQIFGVLQDRVAIGLLLIAAIVLVPWLASDYLLRAIVLPFLILALGAIGLNVLVGYCGQISLGSGAFMAVGAYAAFNLGVRVPGTPVILQLLFGGACATVVGIVFGIPSLRIRGLYLAATTLAAQFFVDWMFLRVSWFTNHSSSGSVSAPAIDVFGIAIATAQQKYLFALACVLACALVAKNLARGAIGRQWMAIRDMDVAAAVIGIRPIYAKLSAFAVSSFIIGISGALWAYLYLGAWEPAAFSLDRSFQLLFMVIIGGLGSIVGGFFGAAFMVLLPIALSRLPAFVGITLSTATVSSLEYMVFGALIITFLIVEPHGLARLWAIGREKARLWPFPH